MSIEDGRAHSPADLAGELALPAGISAVIPVYNSEATLDDLVGRLQPVLAGLGRPYELVLVNDGSRDGSWAAVGRLAAGHPWVRGIDLMRNHGQHNALLCGIRAARYGTTVTLDDDLQNPPEEIPRLLAKLDEGYDVIYGAPEAERHGFLRDMASRITKLVLQETMGAQNARSVSTFRAFRTDLRHAFDSYRSPYVSIDVLLTWGTQRFEAVRVRHDVRQAGVSNYTLRKLITHALNMITGFSVMPLQLASVLGFTISLFGLCILIVVVGRYMLVGTSVAGFPFLASIISIFSGAQMFVMGIMGEYLARMHFRSMERPVYTIRRQANFPGNGE